MSVMPQYEMQCASVKRKNKVLSCEAHLQIPAEDSNPLESPQFSRFVLTLLDSSNRDTFSVFSNVPADDVALIKKITDTLLEEKIRLELSGPAGTENGNESEAYTTQFVYGYYKGKTPAEILSNTPGDRDKLESQIEFLQKNEARYPNNKFLIQGIIKALELFDAGELAKGESGPKEYVVYDRPYKYLKTKKNSEGKVLTYSISIKFNSRMNYPWRIDISNAYASIKTGANGLTTIDTNTIVGNKSVSLEMNSEEYYNLVTKMDDLVRAHAFSFFRQQYGLAHKIRTTKIEQSKQKKNGKSA